VNKRSTDDYITVRLFVSQCFVQFFCQSAILEEKVKLALANGLTPIFCIGEVLEEREQMITSQLGFSLANASFSSFAKAIPS